MRIVDLTEEEQGALLKAAHPTQFTTLQILQTMEQIARANFEEDIKSAIEWLEEDN